MADPCGAAMWSWFKHGHTDIDDGDSVAEGIGQGRVTKNVEGSLVDDAYRVADRWRSRCSTISFGRRASISA